MIALLRGTVASLGDDWAVIDVGGVGYLVYGSRRTLSDLPEVGGAVQLHIETHVREDHIHLYGFGDEAERDWFRLLTTVQGVGAKVALAILSVLTQDDMLHAVAAQDKASFARANGVGAKLAGRIVTELKDKVGELMLAPVGAVVAPGAPAATGGANEEAVSALINLGFSRSEAFGAVMRAGSALGDGAAVDDIIRTGLKELAQ
ncbi:MAG: Holliday junction branch migration protein RuvA [Alphaproteobacteria bacterium]|nr:Holliday junction branch migration protein RuvA [Alphaproteobacteria bacterium]